jgi:hypothetical protein
MPRNEMPRNEMPRNGLTAVALSKNAHLLDTLSSNAFQTGLDQAMTAGEIPTAATDQYDTRKLIEYLASCALDPCETVSASHTLPTGGKDELVLTGELGLCGDKYNEWTKGQTGANRDTLWRSQAASDGCKERVTACVLARVNAFGASVRISMRGDGMTLADEVPVDTLFREGGGTPIHSFATCRDRGITSTLASRNCDWAARHVGRCSRGRAGTTPRTVTVTARGRIRVCEGVYGCDDPAATAGARDLTPLYGANNTPLPSPPRYGGWQLETGTDSVTFTCPNNGPVVGGEQTGYYAVMVDAIAKPKPTVTTSSPASPLDMYPGSEAVVFPYREGAFYGTLFTRPAGPTGHTVASNMLSGNQYACYSSMWTEGQAHLADRLCARVTASTPQCFVNVPRPCESSPAVQGRCTPVSGLSARVEDSCQERQQWQLPYTTYLNHPCDLASGEERCLAQLDLTAAPWLQAQALDRQNRPQIQPQPLPQ